MLVLKINNYFKNINYSQKMVDTFYDCNTYLETLIFKMIKIKLIIVYLFLIFNVSLKSEQFIVPYG